MQWNSSPNAGFSSEGVEPWLPVEMHYKEENVEVEVNNLLVIFINLATFLAHSKPCLAMLG
jgi:hypothetical protein